MVKKLIPAIFFVIAFIVLVAYGVANSEKFRSVEESYSGGAKEDIKNNTGQNTPESTYNEGPSTTPDETVTATPVPTREPTPEPLDLEAVKPDEVGEIPVVMFHAFVKELGTGSHSSDFLEYTTSFDNFRQLLQTLYDKGYRLISLSDMINNEIDVPAGKKPIVFTFDDGTSSQFNLISKDGTLSLNPESALGIMEEFYKQHPDFGYKATFFVNMGLSVFEGAGTVSERLTYLKDHGLEIGNHTLNHAYMPDVADGATMQKEVGKNAKMINESIAGYNANLFSLPFGSTKKELFQYVLEGEYEGVSYKNIGVVEVGWDPSVSPANKNFDPASIHRIRATGFKAVDCDLLWWLERIPGDRIPYISDGDKNTVTVPKSREGLVDTSKLNGKFLRTY